MLKKRYVSDEEEKTTAPHTDHNSHIHNPTAITEEDDIMPNGYLKAFHETLATLHDEEEKSNDESFLNTHLML